MSGAPPPSEDEMLGLLTCEPRGDEPDDRD
jgi:hypothetical protein